MASYNAGSVSAKIQIDTSEFDKSIKRLIEDVGKLKGELSNSGTDQLSKDVESLKTNFNNLTESVNKLVSVNEDYKKQLNYLREENKKINSDLKEQPKAYDNIRTSLENYSAKLGSVKNKLKEFSSSSIMDAKRFNEAWKNTAVSFKRDATEIQNAISKFAGFKTTGKTTALKEYQVELKRMVSQMKSASQEVNRFDTESKKAIQTMSKWALANEKGTNTFEQQQKFIQYIHTGLNKLTGAYVKTTQVLNTFNFKLLEGIDRETIFYRRTLQLASAMQKLNVQGGGANRVWDAQNQKWKIDKSTQTWQGRNVVGGYSTYLSQASNVQQKAVEEANKLKIAMGQLGQAYQKNGINLNTYKANLSNVNAKLDEQRARVNRVKQAQEQLAWIQRTDYLSQYKANMTDINQKLEKQTQATNKLNQSTKTGQASMREFGTTMGKAEAYSNNMHRSLQKVRSVMVSIKTIAGAMGLMAVWGFASDLIEGVKETYSAKSEMESLLAKNTKIDAQGIKEVNSALDEVTQKFQRINKYSLGETAASIGLEFNLSAEQMAKSASIIAMVQNEYARAGRTNEEAALAVKDILQGEFRRLSMETGVGEEDLTGKYGWSGEKEDVMGLLEALEKAGKDRHWDIFAAKATSLNDVITITKNRFGELGADLVTNVEPMILSAFNGIMGAIDFLKGKFDSMGSFGQLTTIGGLGVGTFTAISTALMVMKRNMGLAEIATLGWSKSFGTALFGLKKTDVALHGFWRTLLATVSGTNAASMANVGFGKSLLSRLLGVKANIAGEEGFLKAIMVSQGALRGESSIMTLTAASGLNLSQKLAAVTNNLSATEVQGMKTATAIRKIVTSTKLLRIAFLGLTSVVILGAFATIAARADAAKKSIDNFNNIQKNGTKIADKARERVETYTSKLSELTEGTKKYNKVASKLKIATANQNDIEAANKLYKIHKRDYEARKASVESRKEDRLNDSLKLASDGKQLSTTNYVFEMQQAIEVRNKALDTYDSRLYKASQHINQQVSLMKEAGANEEKRLAYVREYQAEAENTARLWKQFEEGDLKSGFYAVLSELKLIWIDLWNNEHFINFWNTVKKTWEDLKPTISWIKDNLIGIGEALLDFFSTDMGKFTLMAGGIGLVSLKIGKWVSGSSSVFSVLKTVGTKVWDLAKGWKNVGKEAEEASKKMPKTDTSTTTGGINGDVTKGGNTSWWQNTKAQLGKDATNYARAALAIAAAMALVTEAIVLLRAPMGALAELGWQFKQWEPNIRKGIEGLKLIAPVMAVMLPPVVALMLLTNKFAMDFDIVPSFMASVELIAMGMTLVAEAVALLILPMGAIAAVGWVKSLLSDNVEKGKEAIQLVTDTLVGLYPVIPLFAAAIIAGSIAIDTAGVGALYMVGSLAIGMGLVATAVLTLSEPLLAIGVMGATFPDLTAARKGAEAIKLTAEVMQDVAKAVGLMALVEWELLAGNIAHIINSLSGVSLSDLTKDGGFFTQLNDFTKGFNEMEFTPITDDKVSALSNVATGLTSVNTAITQAKEAIDHLPNEFKNSGLEGTTGDKLGIVNNTSKGENTVDTQGYFDQLKEPLKQLKQFIDDFNKSPELDFGEGIDQSKIDAITSAANMLEQVKQAVQKVNDVMWNTGMGNSIANMGSSANIDFGGLINNAVSFLGNPVGSLQSASASGGEGSYVSSLGSQFQDIENIVTDLSTFSSRVSNLTSSDDKTGNVESLTTFVSEVNTQIGNLVKTLNDNVPQAKTNAKNIGSNIISGIKEGLTGLDQMGSYIASKIANSIMTNKDMVYNTSNSLGKTTASKFKEGVNPMSDYMTWELSYVKTAMTDRQTELGDTAYDLGSHIASRFKEGDDINSPGIMARSIQDEMNYIGEYLTNNNLGQMAYDLSNFMSSNFNIDFNLGNFKFPDITGWTNNLSNVLPTIDGFKTQVTTNFTNMKQNVQGSFNSILNKTNTTMTNMKSATLGHIGNIKSSWRGMQDALIASADHIKTQTSNKINTLKTNLGDFWNKIKNPETLIGSAGGHTGSIRRRSRPTSLPKLGYAGGFNFKPKHSKGSPDDLMEEYMKCVMETGKPCYAGWGFNWSNNISNRFKGWKTNFNKFRLDDFLNVGKFENDNFPVRGNADVAKAYIYDVISATRYGSYFDSHFGDDPVAALRAGVFNCWDGANIILAIARAFGFSGGMGHGTWNGIGHVWASIPGLGNIDATAIQNGYGFTSPKVRGYAGSIRRGKSSASVPDGGNTTNNNNEIHIHIEGDVYGVDDLNRKIEEGANKVARRLFRNSYSGV